MVRCPGCGGRNDPNAPVCEWCGRPFVVEHRRLSAPWLVPAVVALLGLLAVLMMILAFASARISSPPPLVDEPVLSGVPLPDWEILVEPEPSPTFPPTLAAAPAAEFVRIANTGGAGAFIRREPRTGAPGIVAYRDGTILRIVGPDSTVDGRVWRQVEDQRGNRGWTPREFLVPSDTDF